MYRAPRTIECGSPRSQGLDNDFDVLTMDLFRLMSESCDHNKTEAIARRDGVDYLRCIDCGQVFEAEDLESVPVYDED